MSQNHLFKQKRGGEAGRRNLQRRITLFENGEWDSLLLEARQNSVGAPSQRDEESREQARINVAASLITNGELSHATRLL